MDIQSVSRIVGDTRIKNVIVSVADKGGLDVFIPELCAINPDITFYSTGGTYAELKGILGPESQKKVIAISDYTGQPEMQGGLVKTLDFKIYLGLLNETFNEAHQKDIERVQGISFDMVVVNLYPFRDVIAKSQSTFEDARGNIDIGGPCMLRAAAKNFLRVTPVCNPSDYGDITARLRETDGNLSIEDRLKYAKKAFAHTAEYEQAICAFFAGQSTTEILETYSITE